MASRCSTALVEPPIAITTVMAFSNASRVIIWRGVMPLSSRLYNSAPDECATSSFRRSMAGMEAAPGIDMPIASMAEDIVFAVNMPAHAPSPGQATRSIAMSSSSDIAPVENAPHASYISCMLMSCPI